MQTAYYPIMRWLPIAPDFRAELRVALDTSEPGECLEKMTTLAGCRLDFLETIQLDRALGRIASKDLPGFWPIRLAVLASSTVDHLAPAIRIAGLRRRLLIDVYNGGYGQYRQEILDLTGSLHQFAPQAILLSLTAREAIANVPLTATAAEVEESITRFIDALRLLWQKAGENHNATVIQQNFIDVTEPLFGSYDRFVPAAPARILARLNDRLYEAAAQDGVFLLDVSRASDRDGIVRYWAMAPG
jgi:predicted enzyme involved in methoxymalonyl-ACP biosynthesis